MGKHTIKQEGVFSKSYYINVHRFPVLVTDSLENMRMLGYKTRPTLGAQVSMQSSIWKRAQRLFRVVPQRKNKEALNEHMQDPNDHITGVLYCI